VRLKNPVGLSNTSELFLPHRSDTCLGRPLVEQWLRHFDFKLVEQWLRHFDFRLIEQ
jgi:hypothetical protein